MNDLLLGAEIGVPLGVALQMIRAEPKLPSWGIYLAAPLVSLWMTSLFGHQLFNTQPFWAQFTVALLTALSANRVTSDAARGTRFATKDAPPKDAPQ